MPPSFQFECQECQFSTNAYSKWRNHLMKESHQIVARERSKTWVPKAKEKAVVVFGVRALGKVHVMRYFGAIAFVTDFVFWNERRDFCIMQFLEPSFFMDWVSKRHNVAGHKLILRRRTDIADEEWTSICSFLSDTIEKIDMNLEGDGSPKESCKDTSNEDSQKITVEENVTLLTRDTTLTVDNRSGSSEGLRKGKRTQRLQSLDLQSTPDICNVVHVQTPGPSPGCFMSDVIPVVSEVNNEVNKKAKKLNPCVPGPEAVPDIPEKSFENDREDLENPEMWDDPPLDETYNDTIYHGQPNNNNSNSYERMEMENDTEMWNFQMDALYNKNLMPLTDWSFQNHAKEKLEQMIRKQFPDCILIPFGAGSTAISLGHERETYNIFADLSGNCLTRNTKKKSDQPIFMEISPGTRNDLKKTLARLLKDGRPLTTDVNYNSNPKASFELAADEIRFTYQEKESQISCRLQMTNFVAVQCCRIIKLMCSLDARVRPLLIVARNWAYHNKLVQSHPGIEQERKSEYFNVAVIQWLVIFFLAKKNIVPPISTIQQYSVTPLIHMGVNLAFCDDPNLIGWIKKYDYEVDEATGNPSARCILSLFQDMLDFLSKVDLAHSILSINIGTKIPKRNSCFRAENNAFSSDHITVQATRVLCTDCAVCVQHPLKLMINMTKNVSYSVGKIFKYTCGETAHKLQFLLNGGLPNCNPVELLNPDSPSSKSVDIPEYVPSAEPRLREVDHFETFVPVSTHRRMNMNPFSSHLQLEKTFRNKSLDVSHPKMKEAAATNLVAVWLELLKDFNDIVWPLCFGMKLIYLTDYTSNVRKNRKQFGYPFKGVLVEPEKLEWLARLKGKNKKGKKVVLHRLEPRIIYKEKLLEFAEMLKSSTATSVSIEDKLPGSVLFEFECRIRVSVSKTLTYADALLEFTNVVEAGMGAEHINTNTMMKLYGALWQLYSERQLCTLKKVKGTDEVTKFFNS